MKQIPERCEWLKVPKYDPDSPYSVLGVRKNATRRSILKKYRDIAKKFHPDLLPHDMPIHIHLDCNVYFTCATQARDILTDEASRVLFDDYGFTGSRYSNDANVLNEAKKMLIMMFDSLCNNMSESDLRTTDMIKTITGMIARNKEAIKQEADKLKGKIAKYELVISRIHSEGDCYITKEVKFKLDTARQQRKDKVGHLRVSDKAAQLLKDYRYDFEKAEPATFTLTSTSTAAW